MTFTAHDQMDHIQENFTAFQAHTGYDSVEDYFADIGSSKPDIYWRLCADLGLTPRATGTEEEIMELPRYSMFGPRWTPKTQGGGMTTTTLGARSICLKCSEEIIYNNVGVTTSIGSPPVMAWTSARNLTDDICLAGGEHRPADTTAGGGHHMIARPAVMPTPDRPLERLTLENLLNNGAHSAEINDEEGCGLVAEELMARGLVDQQGNPTEAGIAAFSALEETKEGTLINPETTRRIGVIDMALSFGADPETSMPLTDDKRRLLEQEKALLEGGASPEEATEATTLDQDVAAMLTNSFQSTPTPEPQVEADCAYPGEPEPAPLGNGDEDVQVVPSEPAPVVADPPTAADNLMNPTPQIPGQPVPTEAPIAPPIVPPHDPSLSDTVKAAVSEALGALLNSGGGGTSSLDDLLAKLDPRDSESALKMFTWLWENHRFQVIGQLNGGGYMLHYAEPKGTSQAGYMPGGTKGGRMVDEALQRAKDNPAAAKHGMCPQCMSAVKQNIETGLVTSDDEKNDPACPAGGNHAFAG